MESVSYTSSSVTRNNFQANNVVPLVKVKIAGFAADTAPVMTTGARLLCFTSKNATDLRLLDRIQAKKVDLVLSFKVAFVAALSGDSLFAAAGETFVALVEAGSHPDGSITAEQKHLVTLDETVRGIAVAGNNSLLVLTANGKLTLVKSDGSTTSFVVPAAAKGASLKSSVVAVHREAALAIVPGKGAALDVVSLNSEQSVLTKPWMPHGDGVPSSAYIFQTRKFGVESSERHYILTGANNNTELRFWTLNEDKNLTLVQQVSLTTTTTTAAASESPADSPSTTTNVEDDDDRMLSISSDEDYVLLASRKTGSIVVVELARLSFTPSRITDWNASGPLSVCSPFVRKVQEGKSLTMDLAAVVRTAEMISIVSFDASRLVGASNVSSGAAAAATSGVAAYTPLASGSGVAAASSGTSALGGRQNSVSKWFGDTAGSNNATASPLVAAAAGAGVPHGTTSASVLAAPPPPQLPTSVSSTISGKYSSVGADSQFVTNQAIGAIKAQTMKFREALSSIDEQIVTLQKQASAAIKALQDTKTKDDAQLAGREFALRNKNRLSSGSAAGGNASQQGGAAAMTAAQVELMQGLRNFVDSLAPSVREASSDTCRKLLASSLPSAIARAMTAADSADQDVALPELSVTKGMQTFSLAVDKVHQSQNNNLKLERNAVEALSVRLMQGSSDRITKTIMSSKSYVNQLKAELSGLRADVQEAKEAVRSTSGKAAAAAGFGSAAAASSAISIEKILEDAARLTQAGKWADAVVLVERTGELSALLHFLISVEESATVLVDPHTLPLTLMVQVCYRLALDIKGQIGNAATRCKWIHDFLVDWDETLEVVKGNDAKTFALVSDQLEAVLDELTGIDVRKDVDRATKNRITLCKRLLTGLLS